MRSRRYLLSKDEEGNGFSPLSSIDEMVYIPNWREVRYRKLTNSMILQGYSEEDVFDSSCGDPGQNAVVLWP